MDYHKTFNHYKKTKLGFMKEGPAYKIYPGMFRKEPINFATQLLVLFGCGGNKDPDKRPKMGRIASDLADYLVITDDNPRLESSLEIMREIQKGVNPKFKDYVLIKNRQKAIESIINHSGIHDMVILAGKGHETYQILKSETIHFDDREEASIAILNRLNPTQEGPRPSPCSKS